MTPVKQLYGELSFHKTMTNTTAATINVDETDSMFLHRLSLRPIIFALETVPQHTKPKNVAQLRAKIIGE